VLLAAGCGDDLPPLGETEASTGALTGSPSDDTDGFDTGDGSSGDTDDGLDPQSVPEPRAGRLTDRQYVYTVQDVLGLRLLSDELSALPADIPSGRDYSTTLEPQAFDSNYVLAYAEVARSVSLRLDPAALVSEHAGCGELHPDCRAALVENLGRRLFRRPLTAVEQGRYLDLAMTIEARPETTEAHVVQGIVQVLLQAPAFLYRLERETVGQPGQVRSIDGYELASRLSYFLWQSAPDDELLAFAAGPAGDGAYDPAALPEQIDRMIADRRFARSRSLFWGDYTLASRSGFATSDPQLAAELRDSLMATLERISGVGGSPQSLSALFDGQRLVMTPAVAELAGATPRGEGLQVYDVAEAEQRQGVVTHPALLASIGTTSFVGRGLFLSERLLCQHVAEPPPEVADEIETTAETTADMTPRQASEFRMNLEAVCLGCHLQFEPIAYAFERYDMTGRYTETDAQGRDLFSHGELPAFGPLPALAFDDAEQLLTQLAETDAVYGCLVENMTQFGTGRPSSRTGPFHADATARFIAEGRTFESLVRSVAGSEQRTLLRVVEP